MGEVFNRNLRMMELRQAGYSYSAIAEVLYREGLTTTQVSKQFINKVLRREAPELLGSVKRKLGVAKLIKKEAKQCSNR